MASSAALEVARRLLHTIKPSRWVADVLGVRPDPYQTLILDAHLTSSLREVALLAGRQSGKSTLASWIVAHTLVHKPNAVAIAAAPAMRQASELVRRVRQVLQLAGAELSVSNTFGLELKNGARMLAVPGGEGSVGARGFSAHLVVVDEAAFVADATMSALRPMTATIPDARIIAIGSAGASIGWFHDMWRERDPAVLYFSITADQVPRIDPTFLARERRALGEARYQREFFNQFDVPGAGFFGAEWFQMFDRRGVVNDPPVVPTVDPDQRAEQDALIGARAAVSGMFRRAG